MAHLKNGILSGLLGNAVLSNWKGNPVVKVKAKNPNNPQTVAQTNNRKSFAAISKFCSLHKKMIKIGFQGHENTSYPMNEARSVNAPKLTVTGVWPDITIHYDKIKISAGTLPAPREAFAEINENQLTINWKGNENLQESSNTDFLMVMFHYPDEEENLSQAVHHLCVAKRMDNTITIPLENRINNHFHAWMFFMNQNLNADPNKKNISNSKYLGEFNV